MAEKSFYLPEPIVGKNPPTYEEIQDKIDNHNKLLKQNGGKNKSKNKSKSKSKNKSKNKSKSQSQSQSQSIKYKV